MTFKGVTLGNDVWVGANAIILDGVNIGNHSIVAAGAVVTKSFPPYSILAGNPAKRVRDRRKGPLAIYRLEDKNSGLKYHFDIDFSSYISCSNGFPLRGWVLHSDLDSIIVKTKTSSDVLSINRKRPNVINHFNEGVNNKIDCGFDYSLDMIDYYSIYIKTSINIVHLADIIQEEIITND
ncbi:TPA: hypothetical protein NU536_004190 [Escherichia coli]|nr:hypothetical protein [Escherichia coli]